MKFEEIKEEEEEEEEEIKEDNDGGIKDDVKEDNNNHIGANYVYEANVEEIDTNNYNVDNDIKDDEDIDDTITVSDIRKSNKNIVVVIEEVNEELNKLKSNLTTATINKDEIVEATEYHKELVREFRKFQKGESKNIDISNISSLNIKTNPNNILSLSNNLLHSSNDIMKHRSLGNLDEFDNTLDMINKPNSLKISSTSISKYNYIQ